MGITINRKPRYPVEIRNVDAWRDGDGWTENATYHIILTKMCDRNINHNIRVYCNRHHLIKRYAHVNIADYDGFQYCVEALDGEPLYYFVFGEA
jgi:hypothetical protein